VSLALPGPRSPAGCMYIYALLKSGAQHQSGSLALIEFGHNQIMYYTRAGQSNMLYKLYFALVLVPNVKKDSLRAFQKTIPILKMVPPHILLKQP
jgi:hypothetical protein